MFLHGPMDTIKLVCRRTSSCFAHGHGMTWGSNHGKKPYFRWNSSRPIEAGGPPLVICVLLNNLVDTSGVDGILKRGDGFLPYTLPNKVQVAIIIDFENR